VTKSRYTPAQISSTLFKLRTEADNPNRSLCGNNQAVYNLLRYGVPVKIEARKVTETVHLINWNEPEKNDFVIVEEVTVKGDHERRPDILLYVNGNVLITDLITDPITDPPRVLQESGTNQDFGEEIG
jgi:type I restriction enzyme, R subunit